MIYPIISSLYIPLIHGNTSANLLIKMLTFVWM